jgi:polyhydroxyalkanoate synthesis regulator phasin
MKKILTIVAAGALAMGIVISGMALATGPGDRPQRGFGFQGPRENQTLMQLTHYQHQNIKSQVLSELSGQSAEAINQKLKSQRMRAVIEELGIDRQAFRSAMQTKINNLIKQAAADGTITAEQEKAIFEKMENHANRREIMSRLIEKGIEDGTITQQQAQTLMRKPRR